MPDGSGDTDVPAGGRRTAVGQSQQVLRQHHHQGHRGGRRRTATVLHPMEPDHVRERVEVGLGGRHARHLQLEWRRQGVRLRPPARLHLQVPRPGVGLAVSRLARGTHPQGALRCHHQLVRPRQGTVRHAANDRRGERGHRQPPAGQPHDEGEPGRRRQDWLRLAHQSLRDGLQAVAGSHPHLQRLQLALVGCRQIHRPRAHPARRRSTHRRLRQPGARRVDHQRRQPAESPRQAAGGTEDADVHHRA